MKHLFIPYELAVKLKDLGFDEDCLGVYDAPYFLGFLLIGRKTKKDLVENEFLAPLYQQVVDWLREKHKIIIEAILVLSKGHEKYGKFTVLIIQDLRLKTIECGYYPEYYQALTKAIEEALKLINTIKETNLKP